MTPIRNPFYEIIDSICNSCSPHRLNWILAIELKKLEIMSVEIFQVRLPAFHVDRQEMKSFRPVKSKCNNSLCANH